MSTKDNSKSSIRNIEHLIERIIFLLKDNDCSDWISIFKELLHGCKTRQEDEVVKKILSIYGGMGSFNDLVLQKNYKKSMSEEEYEILLEGNDKLDKLRHELYNACKFYNSSSE